MSKIGLFEATNHQESEQLLSNSQFNNNNMKLVEFDLAKLNTGNYNPVLGNGEPVKIAAINPDEKYAILGWAGGATYSWEIDGSYGVLGNNTFRLYLTPVKTKVYITVTRNKDGKINVYGSTEKEPSLKKESELLKRVTVEVE